MLAHSPTFLLSSVRSMIPTSARCLDMACNIIPSSHSLLLWIRIRGLVQMLSYIILLIQLRPFFAFLITTNLSYTSAIFESLFILLV
jgi:hypothetical protein